MPYFQSATRRLHYERSGQADKPALLLLNGITMNTTAWTFLLPRLEACFDVLRLDFCGQGLSEKPDEASYPLSRQADDIAALLNQLQLARVHVAGLSYGGMVAQHLALRHPTRVAALLLSSTLAWSDPVNALIAHNWETADSQGGAELRFATSLPWLFSARFLAARTEMLPQLKAIAATLDWPAAQRLSRGVLEHDARNWLGSLRVDTQVVVGSEDRLTPPYHARLLADSIAGAQLQLLDGAAHALHLEAPDALAHAIIRFMSQRPT